MRARVLWHLPAQAHAHMYGKLVCVNALGKQPAQFCSRVWGCLTFATFFHEEPSMRCETTGRLYEACGAAKSSLHFYNKTAETGLNYEAKEYPLVAINKDFNMTSKMTSPMIYLNKGWVMAGGCLPKVPHGSPLWRRLAVPRAWDGDSNFQRRTSGLLMHS